MLSRKSAILIPAHMNRPQLAIMTANIQSIHIQTSTFMTSPHKPDAKISIKITNPIRYIQDQTLMMFSFV